MIRIFFATKKPLIHFLLNRTYSTFRRYNARLNRFTICSCKLVKSKKTHYISFVAAASSDGMQIVKLYPEGNAEARFRIKGVKRIYFYCNRDGLYYIDPIKGIDDKESGYDDSQERRELEQAAKTMFWKEN